MDVVQVSKTIAELAELIAKAEIDNASYSTGRCVQALTQIISEHQRMYEHQREIQQNIINSMMGFHALGPKNPLPDVLRSEIDKLKTMEGHVDTALRIIDKSVKSLASLYKVTDLQEALSAQNKTKTIYSLLIVFIGASLMLTSATVAIIAKVEAATVREVWLVFAGILAFVSGAAMILVYRTR